MVPSGNAAAVDTSKEGAKNDSNDCSSFTNHFDSGTNVTEALNDSDSSDKCALHRHSNGNTNSSDADVSQNQIKNLAAAYLHGTKGVIDSDNDTQREKHSNHPCEVCDKPSTTRCSRCKVVYYCSVECQRTDWKRGGRCRKLCSKLSKGRGHRSDKSLPKNPKASTIRSGSSQNDRSEPKIPIGPSLPPPSTVRNERDAKRALQELWSIAGSAMAGDDATRGSNPVAHAAETARSTNEVTQHVTSKPSFATGEPTPPTKSTPSVTQDATKAQGSHDCHQPQRQEGGDIPSPRIPEAVENGISFVVEEMPQICRFQLTLQQRRENALDLTSLDHASVSVLAEPLGRSKSRTKIVVRLNQREASSPNDRSVLLFVGDFPRPIEASRITWNVIQPTNGWSRNNDPESDHNKSVFLVVKLPYPLDPANTSSLALGGSLGQYYSSSSSTSTLEEINRVQCGICHLPLVVPNHATHSKAAMNDATESIIRRVYPLPQGHWEEIAEYLICYPGEPVVNFAAGSEVAEPSIALQDASLLCFHKRDVEKSVCALAVDGYGGFAEEREEKDQKNSTDENDELGMFQTKSPSPFELPSVDDDVPEANDEEGNEEKKDEGDEPPIPPNSAVFRGERSWQDAADGDSVSLCCGRCCAPLGFVSLGSPETWRLWKHRLSIPKPTKSRETPGQDTKCERFGKGLTLPTAFSAEESDIPVMAALPSVQPLASCTSFLARELVRYAESKAIFTFVVRSEELDEDYDDEPMGGSKLYQKPDDTCLLLRLLSWETAMATTWENTDGDSSVPRTSDKLGFRKVAKIVFEETKDPTVRAARNSNNHGGEATQWFWGGVDLCCLPPSPTSKTPPSTCGDSNNKTEKAISTVRLQLPRIEYETVRRDLLTGTSLFEREIANATIMLKMGGTWKGLGLTAVVLE